MPSAVLTSPKVTVLPSGLVQMEEPAGTDFWYLNFYDSENQMLSNRDGGRSFYLNGSVKANFTGCDNKRTALNISDIFSSRTKQIICEPALSSKDRVVRASPLDESHVKIEYYNDSFEIENMTVFVGDSMKVTARNRKQ